MKNFLCKSFIVGLVALPFSSYAGVDCGSHKVLNVYHGGDHGAILFAVAKIDGSVTKYARPDMNVFNTSDKIRSLTSLVTAAKISGSTLRINVADGGSCSEGEYRTYAVVLE